MWQLLIPAMTSILDKVLPDPQAAADAKLKMLQMVQTGEMAELQAVKDMATAQLEVNKAEASSGNAYAAGWRPTIGYVCAAALAWMYVLQPLAAWGLALWKPDITPPVLPIDEHLWEIIAGMLGMAGWRTLDKIKGKAS